MKRFLVFFVDVLHCWESHGTIIIRSKKMVLMVECRTYLDEPPLGVFPIDLKSLGVVLAFRIMQTTRSAIPLPSIFTSLSHTKPRSLKLWNPHPPLLMTRIILMTPIYPCPQLHLHIPPVGEYHQGRILPPLKQPHLALYPTFKRKRVQCSIRQSIFQKFWVLVLKPLSLMI